MKRRLVLAAIFLLAGAVVNVAVAWGCAYWISVPPVVPAAVDSGFWRGPLPSNADSPQKWWGLGRWKAPGTTRFIIHFLPVWWSPDAPPGPTVEQVLPRWAYMAHPTQVQWDKCDERLEWIVDGRGWPLRSMGCRVDLEPDWVISLRPVRITSTRAGVLLDPLLRQGFAELMATRVLPLARCGPASPSTRSSTPRSSGC